MVNIGIVVASTRPGRLGRDVGEWVLKAAVDRGSAAQFELIDLADFDLPVFDETVVPMVTPGVLPHTRRWADAVARLDGFVFVTPEYNHGIPAALKNAVDFLYTEWNTKAAGFVSYGVDGGVRAVEHMRGVMAQVRVATVVPQVTLVLATDFRDYSELAPQAGRDALLTTMLAELVAWSRALREVRTQDYTSEPNS